MLSSAHPAGHIDKDVPPHVHGINIAKGYAVGSPSNSESTWIPERCLLQFGDDPWTPRASHPDCWLYNFMLRPSEVDTLRSMSSW